MAKNNTCYGSLWGVICVLVMGLFLSGLGLIICQGIGSLLADLDWICL